MSDELLSTLSFCTQIFTKVNLEHNKLTNSTGEGETILIVCCI